MEVGLAVTPCHSHLLKNGSPTDFDHGRPPVESKALRFKRGFGELRYVGKGKQKRSTFA